MNIRAGECALGVVAAILLAFVLREPTRAAGAIRDALAVCSGRLIPSLFPFLCLFGMLERSGGARVVGRLIGRSFEYCFGLPGECACGFLLGSIGGFPGGAIAARGLLDRGAIDAESAERMTALSSNSGLAFCVGGVGAALYGDARLGLMLWLAQMASAIALGLLSAASTRRVSARTRSTERSTSSPASSEVSDSSEPTRTSDSKKPGIMRLVADSIVTSGRTMLDICAFAVFFALLGELVCLPIGELTAHITGSGELGGLVGALSASLCELTLATRLAADSGTPGLLVCAFALGFGGASVHMQTASVLEGSRIPMGRFVFIKAGQGIISALIIGVSLLWLRG